MKKKFLAVLLVIALCLSLAPLAMADSSVTYKGNAEKFVFAPGSEQSPTDLFTDLKGVMPGDELTQTIQVKNEASNKVKVKIYLRALGAQPDSEEFLSKLTLTVSEKGGNKLFEAPANETAQLSDWVCLGTFFSGDDTTLSVTLSVPADLDNEFQNAVGLLDWEFAVEEFPISDDDPKTGDSSNVPIYAAIAAVSFAAIVFIGAKLRKKEEQ